LALIRQEIDGSEWVPPELKAAALADLDRPPDGAAVCHWDFHPAVLRPNHRARAVSSGCPSALDQAI